MAGQFRIQQGQYVVLSTISSAVATVRARVTVRYDSGKLGTLTVTDSVVSSSVVGEDWQSTTPAAEDGEILQVEAIQTTTRIQRGQLLAKLSAGPAGSRVTLAQNYLYDYGTLSLGIISDPGPGGGSGYLAILGVVGNAAPVATVTRALATLHTIRKYLGFSWYYKCSAVVAARLLNVSLRSPVVGGLPTGWATPTKADMWRATQVTLTASQEGGMWVSGERASQNTDGTVAVDNDTTAPAPFPYWADGAASFPDVGELDFLTTLGDAGDVNTIVVLFEQWIVF